MISEAADVPTDARALARAHLLDAQTTIAVISTRIATNGVMIQDAIRLLVGGRAHHRLEGATFHLHQVEEATARGIAPHQTITPKRSSSTLASLV